MEWFTVARDLATKHGLTDDQRSVLVTALRAWDNANDELARQCHGLRETADRVERHLNNGWNVNSLGELQSQGLKFDLQCQARQLAADQLLLVSVLLGLTAEEVGL